MEAADDLVGIIGGSGFYELLDDAEDLVVETPFGAPASTISVGTFAGRRVAFLARHGRDHSYVAHRVPFRANIWALHSLGVRSVIAPCSVGSLQPDIHPGQLVVVDQIVDRTHGRADTFHDVGGPVAEPGAAGPVHHQTFADPYDAGLRAGLVAAGERLRAGRPAAGLVDAGLVDAGLVDAGMVDAGLVDAGMVDGGTMVVINGPRFSTRAESRWFRQMGWQVVNMTGYPEAVLAAELGLRYATVALVTDYDAGIDGATPVTMDAVFAVMRANVARVRELIAEALTDPAFARP